MGISLCFQMLVKGLWGPDDYLVDGPFDIRPSLEPSLAKSAVNEDDKIYKISHASCTGEALKPVRVFSFNHRVPIINLSDGANFRFLFVSGHLAVIYDVRNNEQHILRGHVSSIHCFLFSLKLLVKFSFLSTPVTLNI